MANTNDPISVGIIGVTGYTGLELARLVLSHPRAELTVATSRSEIDRPIYEIHPSLTARCDVLVQPFDAATVAQQCDIAMCCLPHGASAETVRLLIDQGLRVIDFSADFRLASVDVYQQWYHVEHPWPERVGSTAYGMPEFFRDQIRHADLVANPGCYPTSAILPLAPLVRKGLINATDIIIDSKSGVSGAGRSPKLNTLYCEANESIAAYAVAQHRHQPEIDDLIERISNQQVRTLFTPHLTPMDRGILSTIYVRPDGSSADDIMRCWETEYADSPFVHPVEHLPATKHVAGTNHVQMTARDAADRIVLVSVIDNLAKGASGAAIQNMNVMYGLPESMGLD